MLQNQPADCVLIKDDNLRCLPRGGHLKRSAIEVSCDNVDESVFLHDLGEPTADEVAEAAKPNGDTPPGTVR